MCDVTCTRRAFPESWAGPEPYNECSIQRHGAGSIYTALGGPRMEVIRLV